MIMALVTVLVLSTSGCNKPGATYSRAHEASAWSVVDPVYSVGREKPQREVREGAPWLYGQVELESHLLQKMRISSKAVAHHGHYPGAYHTPYHEAAFRLEFPDGVRLPASLYFRSVGDPEIRVDGEMIFSAEGKESGDRLKFSHKGKRAHLIEIIIRSPEAVPALLIPEGPFSTDHPGWLWLSDRGDWLPAARHDQTASGIAPHEAGLPEVELVPAGREGVLFDFGRSLIGYVTFISTGTPSLIVGESIAEAMDTVVANHEQILTLEQTAPDKWKSMHPLAFRYLRILGGEPEEVKCRAQFWPTAYRGAFACSDSLLTRIWMVSAYTHRLNKYQFMLDGIKRDRLPWVDNMKISSAVEAMTFGDPEIIRRTLSVLGRASDRSSINNIIDYDALWLIGQEAFQLHFDDPAFLKQEWPRIFAMVERISGECDENGLRRWPAGSWTFIDWVGGWDKNMAEQVMWWWALNSAVRLAERVGEPEVASAWSLRADQLREFLNRRAWNEDLRAWTDPDKPVAPTRHANLLSIVSALNSPVQTPGAMGVLTDTLSEPLNSPSMITYRIMALNRNGHAQQALDELRSIWGAMLAGGSTTFWEGFDERESGDEIYRFYGRPYGKSMCHAWGSGPVFMLPEILLGIKPLEDGWKSFEVDPNLLGLDWVFLTIPSRYGTIRIEVEGNTMLLDIPSGVTAYHQQRQYSGTHRIPLTSNLQPATRNL